MKGRTLNEEPLLKEEGCKLGISFGRPTGRPNEMRKKGSGGVMEELPQHTLNQQTQGSINEGGPATPNEGGQETEEAKGTLRTTQHPALDCVVSLNT